MNHFLYPRHFLLLTCFSVSLGVITRLHLLSVLSVSFALYGALHASALVLTLRARQPLWRQCLFIAMAAGLSVMTLRVGIIGMRLLGTLPGNIGSYTALGLSAVTGAVTYGMSIRLFGIFKLTLKALAVVSIGCMVAAYVAFFTLAHFQSPGLWWLVVLWWYAFSGGLWYSDRRQYVGSQRRHPGRQ